MLLMATNYKKKKISLLKIYFLRGTSQKSLNQKKEKEVLDVKKNN